MPDSSAVQMALVGIYFISLVSVENPEPIQYCKYSSRKDKQSIKYTRGV